MTPPAVFVFVQKGCGACHDYMPRFERVAEPFRNAGFPVGVYDLATNQHASEFATKLGVNATPTTVVMDRAGRLHKRIGSLEAGVLQQLLALAVK